MENRYSAFIKYILKGENFNIALFSPIDEFVEFQNADSMKDFQSKHWKIINSVSLSFVIGFA